MLRQALLAQHLRLQLRGHGALAAAAALRRSSGARRIDIARGRLPGPPLLCGVH